MIIGAVNKAVTANKNPKSTFPVEKLSSPDTVPGILQGVLVVYPSTPNVTQVIMLYITIHLKSCVMHFASYINFTFSG